MNDVTQNENPKQVLIDWVDTVRSAAIRANNTLHSDNKDAKDYASDYMSTIIGACDVMNAVLKNSK